MIREVLRIGTFVALCLAPAWAVAELAGRADNCSALAPVRFKESSLTIETENAHHDFRIELAATSGQRARGLMCRLHLAPDHGMLFDFGSERTVTMWMKNTYLPLDMLFIKRDGTVARIAERTVPQSLIVISSGTPVQGVLELSSGTVARLGIRPGDRVIHPIFQAPE